MTNDCINTIKQLIQDYELDCTVDTFKDYTGLDWYEMVRCHPLSEDFIREFKNHWRWNWIFKYHKLSENFIRDFKSEVDWESVSQYQKLTLNFIREFKEEVDWDWLIFNKHLDIFDLKDLKQKIDKDTEIELEEQQKKDFFLIALD